VGVVGPTRAQCAPGADLAGDVADVAAVVLDRQGTSVAWCTAPVRLSWTNTASRRLRRSPAGSIAKENRCVAGVLPSSSTNSYFVSRAGKRATSDLPAFSPDGT